jgi:hypothetical protein
VVAVVQADAHHLARTAQWRTDALAGHIDRGQGTGLDGMAETIDAIALEEGDVVVGGDRRGVEHDVGPIGHHPWTFVAERTESHEFHRFAPFLGFTRLQLA